MIGVGNMGAMMSLLLAEYGIIVYHYDTSLKNSEALGYHARQHGLHDRIHSRTTHESLCGSLSSPRVIMFSIPHGSAGDQTIDALKPWLSVGDMIIDASNEHWEATERRQRRLKPDSIEYVGMGVSGGYQSARHGPSLCPGGAPEALERLFPFLQTIAARDNNGRPCVAKVGPGGCGHYIKMVHNGIEQGMMGALCEVWGILIHGLGMSYEEISGVFKAWDDKGPLRANFLISIGADICKAKDPDDGSYVVDQVRDKVVQDYDDTEGTGTWTCEEGARLHVPIPVIAASHFFRLASADARQRDSISRSMEDFQPQNCNINDRNSFLEDLQNATYAAFLASFIQGLHLISAANEKHGWHLDFCAVLQIWRGGSIIQSDDIVDLLEAVYRSAGHDENNLLSHELVSRVFADALPSLKNTVAKAVESDAYIPALAATLEYLKYSGATNLPTSFQEAQLDYFGEHMYDLKSQGPGMPVTGKHHFEWKPAQGIFGT
jgi:6-phosphogluconate dehydrogenase